LALSPEPVAVAELVGGIADIVQWRAACPEARQRSIGPWLSTPSTWRAYMAGRGRAAGRPEVAGDAIVGLASSGLYANGYRWCATLGCEDFNLGTVRGGRHMELRRRRHADRPAPPATLTP
jgi:hypothetical protein